MESGQRPRRLPRRVAGVRLARPAAAVFARAGCAPPGHRTRKEPTPQRARHHAQPPARCRAVVPHPARQRAGHARPGATHRSGQQPAAPFRARSTAGRGHRRGGGRRATHHRADRSRTGARSLPGLVAPAVAQRRGRRGRAASQTYTGCRHAARCRQRTHGVGCRSGKPQYRPGLARAHRRRTGRTAGGRAQQPGQRAGRGHQHGGRRTKRPRTAGWRAGAGGFRPGPGPAIGQPAGPAHAPADAGAPVRTSAGTRKRRGRTGRADRIAAPRRRRQRSGQDPRRTGAHSHTATGPSAVAQRRPATALAGVSQYRRRCVRTGAIRPGGRPAEARVADARPARRTAQRANPLCGGRRSDDCWRSAAQRTPATRRAPADALSHRCHRAGAIGGADEGGRPIAGRLVVGASATRARRRCAGRRQRAARQRHRDSCACRRRKTGARQFRCQACRRHPNHCARPRRRCGIARQRGRCRQPAAGAHRPGSLRRPGRAWCGVLRHTRADPRADAGGDPGHRRRQAVCVVARRSGGGRV